LAFSALGAVVGAIASPIVGALIDHIRGTKAINAKKAKQAAKIAEKSNLLDSIETKVLDLRLSGDVIPLRTRTTLVDEVIKIEESIGTTWRTMEILEGLGEMAFRDDPPSGASTPSVFSRQSSNIGSQTRIPMPSSGSSRAYSSSSSRSSSASSLRRRGIQAISGSSRV
jgi:hypothetical protein